MSSLPGLTLESYVQWAFDITVEGDDDPNTSMRMAEMLGTVQWRRPVLTPEEFQPILALVEGKRASIEYWLEQFDEEYHGWRQYSSGVTWWDASVDTQIFTYLKDLAAKSSGASDTSASA